ncbi:hypothetical protein BGZ91_010102 [Linnemannia elongata]|nr:hypothetical protein BGZ91_010102 [Linnemannia elongata]
MPHYHRHKPFPQEHSPSATTTKNIIPERSKLSITSFLAPPGSEKHSNAYETIADSFFKGSKPDRAAKKLFINLDHKNRLGSDPVAPMVMLNDAISSRNAKQVWHTYTRLKSKAASSASRRALFSSSLYTRMLICFQATKTAEAARWARAIFDDMTEHFSPKVRTLNIMLDILTRHQDLKDAIEFFEHNAARYNLTATLQSYNVMIRGLGHSGQMEAARKIYDDMRAGVIPVKPDVVTYSTLMGQYARKGLQTEADAVLDDMFKDKVQPNMWIFNSVIKRFVQRKDYVGARRTMALMKNSNVQPDVVTYSTLIDGYARDGDEEAIARIQAEMATNKVYPNATTITSTIKVFARANLNTDIDAQLAGLLKSLPTGEMNELTFGVLVDVYGKRKDLDAAKGIYDHIISKGRTVNDVIVNTLLDGYVNANQLSAANKIFHDHFTARGLDNAQQMMRLMRNAKMTIPVQTFTMLMDYLSNVRDVRGTLRYYQEMLDSGIKADVHCYTVLINAQIRAKNFAGCDQAFQQMTKMGIKPNLQTFTSMVHAHSLQGNTERVKEYWEAINYSGLLPDLKAFTTLMQHYGQQSNVEMVEHIFKEIDRRRLEVDAIALMTMISAYSSLPKLNLGRIEEISGMLEERELEPNGEYFRVLLDTYGRHGLPDRVIKTWKQAKSQDKLAKWVPSTSNLLHLIEACRDRGYMDTLHAIWQSATTIATPISDSIQQDPSLHVSGNRPESGTLPYDSHRQDDPLIATSGAATTTALGLGAGARAAGRGRLICPAPEVFTAYLNALLTHNRFKEIERLLEDETREMRLMPRSEDFELMFTSLAQYGFLKNELESIRGIVVRRWPNFEPLVDKVISHTRKI